VAEGRWRPARHPQRFRQLDLWRAGPAFRRIARLLVEEEGLFPATASSCAGPTERCFRLLARHIEGGRHRRRHHADPAPGRDRDHPERAQVSHAIVDSRFIGDFRQGAEQAGTVRSLLRYDGDYGQGRAREQAALVAPGFAPSTRIATIRR
jgi:2-aminobenzoate-CoA ligase